jgi:tellurium resistance protein TerD
MSINLVKGQKISLDKAAGASNDAGGLVAIGVGLGWDTNESVGSDFDLDASAFCLNSSGKLPDGDHFIFYNNLSLPSGAVTHTGDNTTGEGEGDDETIMVDMSKDSGSVEEIIFVATIHDAETRRQNFGQVRNAFIRIFNSATNEEILKYELDEDFSIETALSFGRLYKRGGEWKFEASGSGSAGGLQSFVDKYM